MEWHLAKSSTHRISAIANQYEVWTFGALNTSTIQPCGLVNCILEFNYLLGRGNYSSV